MDGLGIRTLVREWNDWFAGARIDKIQQPATRELVLVLRSQGSTRRVLLSAHRQFARAHLLRAVRPQNPQEPPMFCMLLRRRIEGGRILRVWQPGFERIICIEIDAQNDIGDLVRYQLILEVMGKHSNLMLVSCNQDGETQKIVDAIVHVTPDMSRVRTVYPGKDYVLPPPQDKATMDELTVDSLTEALSQATTEKQLERAVISVLQGVGTETVKEALFRARTKATESPPSAQEIHQALKDLFALTLSGEESPSLALDDLGRPAAAFPFICSYVERIQKLSSFDEATEQLYEAQLSSSQFSAEYQSIVSTVKETLNRLRGKENKLTREREDSLDSDEPRIFAELLMTYAMQIDKGQTTVELPNFYDNDEPISIPLNPALSATQNATHYFKVASKRKRAIPLLDAELANTKRDIDYLETVLATLEQTEPDHYGGIRHELQRQGFLSRDKGRPNHKKAQQKNRQSDDIGRPDEFVSSDGYRIRVGRNNLQNDRLTLRQSQPGDIWLHVKDAPGSHVVIETGHQALPETTLHEAALLAAYFSRLRTATNVPVDYTEVRHIWKANGARPGHVLYDHQKTLYATPDKSLFDQLTDRSKT